MTKLSDVLDRAKGLLDTEGPLDLEAVSAVAVAFRTTAAPQSDAQRDMVQPILDALQRRTADELASVGEALRDIGTARKALRGYGHMRSTKTSQATDRRA